MRRYLRIELVEDGSTTHLTEVRVNRVLAERLVEFQSSRVIRSLFYQLLLPLLRRFHGRKS